MQGLWGLIPVLAFVLGCTPASPGKLLWRPPVTSVELAPTGLTDGKDPRRLQDREGREQISAPPGRVAGQCRLSRGRDSYVALEERVNAGAVPSVTLFGLDWRPLGSIEPQRVRPGHGDWLTSALWSPSGKRLALSFRERGGDFRIVVGTVSPPSASFHELFHGAGEWSDMAWVGDQLFWAFQAGRSDNRIVSADLAHGTVSEVHRDHLYGYIGDLLPSPGSSVIAFGRRFDWDDRAGVWMLDLRTRTCHEVTFEESESYCHEPLAWEGPTSLLFWRAKEGGAWDVYRAHLQAAGASRKRR